MKKRLLAFVMAVVMVVTVMPWAVLATNNVNQSTLAVGDYITFGTYLGEPILWRCVDIDENGPLMLSDKILCLKAFDAAGTNSTYHTDGWGYIRKQYGSNCWSDSSIRQWLNSAEDVVDYTHCPPNSANVVDNPYASEAGFLSGFTKDEIALIKSVTNVVNVNYWETRRSGYWDGGNQIIYCYTPSKTDKDYTECYYQNVTDKMFLLTATHADTVYQFDSDYYNYAYPTEAAVENSTYKADKLSPDKPWFYSLANPWQHNNRCYELVSIVNYPQLEASCGIVGIRPAFYLTTDNLQEIEQASGSLSESEDTTTDNYTIHVVNHSTGLPIAGATVTLGGSRVTTDSNGKAFFVKPKAGEVELKISASSYNTLEIEGYSSHNEGGSDTIEMYPTGVTEIVPKTCNGISISTSYAQINNKADMYAEIDIGGVSTSGINSFELRQNGVILARSSTGKFKLHNSVFKKDVPIIAYMLTGDGRGITKQLNIDVVSFSFFPTVFPFDVGSSVEIPEDVKILGGLKLKFQNEDETKAVDFEVTNSQIKVGYNQKVAEKDLSALNKGLRKWMEEHNRKTPSSGLSFNVAGYVMINMGNDGVEGAEGEVHFIVKFTEGVKSTFKVLVIVPIKTEVKMTIAGEVILKIEGYDFDKAEIIFPEVDAQLKGSIRGDAKVWGVAGPYVDVGATITFGVYPKLLIKKVVGTGDFGVDVKIGKRRHSVSIIKGEFVFFERGRAITADALQALATEAYDENVFYINPREYLADRTEWNTTSDGILQASTYDNANPRIITTDDVTLMVFLDDNGSEDAYNHQQLVYSIYTAYGWSTPVSVDANGLNDEEFDICTDGKDIWVVYTQASRLITEDDTISEDLGTIEVTAARFDPESGTFTDHAVLTSNAVMERLPAITVVNGIPTAVWVENADNNLFGMGANNTVYTSTYENGAWMAPEAVYDAPAVAELDAGILDGALAIALVCDSDSDFTTTDDSVLTILCGGTETTLTDSEYSGVLFDGGTMYWRDVNGLYSTVSFGGEGTLLTDALTADSTADFDVVTMDGVKHIFYREYNTEGEHGGSDIYVIRESGDGWTLPVRLTETEGYIDSYDAIAMNGNIQVVYRRTDVTFTEDDMTAVSALHAETIAPAVALTVSDITFDHEELFDDKTVTLTVSVTNNGINAANGFRAAVDGIYVDYTDTVEAGETVEIDITAALPPYGETDLTVTVTDEIGMTTAEAVTVGYADFTVSLEPKTIGGTPYINASVSNVGNGIGEGVLNLRRDDEEGEIIYTEEIYLAPGEQKNILSEVLDNTLTHVYMEFIPAEEDYFDGDNRTSCAIMRPTGEGLNVRLVGDMNNDDTVDIDDAMLLFRNSMLPEVYPTDYTENTDFNGDGDVDIRDAQRLFQYSMLPDVYPIG